MKAVGAARWVPSLATVSCCSPRACTYLLLCTVLTCTMTRTSLRLATLDVACARSTNAQQLNWQVPPRLSQEVMPGQ
jgi:hypothetical protein